MTIPKVCDVVVIGGGPAGSMVSALLSKKGYHVVLLEKDKHPRVKVGESLIPHFWKYCDLMGVTAEVEAAGFVKKNGGWILWEGELKGVSFADYGFSRPGLHVERDILDEIFIRKSAQLGTQVFEQVTVLEIEKINEKWKTYFRRSDSDDREVIESTIVVDASGQSAITAKQLGFRKFDDGFKFLSFWGYYTGGSYLSIDLNVESFGNQKNIPPATFISSLGNWGWSWQIPLQEKTSVGVVIPREDMDEFTALGDTLEERLQEKVKRIPVLGNLMAGAEFHEGSTAGIKDYSYLPEKVAFENCFLIGDAAAFVDPINSAGVPIGMFAGYLASWAIDGILRNPKRKEYYHTHFSHQYISRLHLFRLIAFPGDKTDQKVKLAAEKALSLSSKIELGLVLAQTATINRASNVQETIDRLGLGHIQSPVRLADENQWKRFNQLLPIEI